MSFCNKSIHRAIVLIQKKRQELTKPKAADLDYCWMAENPHNSVEDFDHVLGTLLGLNPTAKIKDFPKMPVGLAWEKCLPGINWVISITLKCQGQAWRGTSASPRSTSHPAPATDASKEGGKWKIRLHNFRVGHDPP